MRPFAPSIIPSLPRLHTCSSFQVVKRCSTRRIARSLHRSQNLGSARFASTRIKGVYDVPVGGNGFVSLSVIQPKSAKNNDGNVIIHLPQGPLFKSQGLSQPGDNTSPQSYDSSKTIKARRAPEDSISARALANHTSSTVVTINYRLGELPFNEAQLSLAARIKLERGEAKPENLYYRYPTLVHDTLTGFDWVLETLNPKRLGVVGTHIGGSLALMLALTEPRSVHAVAATDPIVDWTSLDEYCVASEASLPKRKHAPRDLVPLLEARERLFSSQERYFDFFASPILFLRSAGKDTPKVFPRYLTGPEYSVPVLISNAPLEERELWDAYIPDDTHHDEIGSASEPDSGYGSHEDDNGSRPARRRKALSRWPPYGLDYGNAGPPERYSREPVEKLEVELPWVRILSTQQHSNGTETLGTSDPPPQPSPSEEVEGETDQSERKPPTRRRRNQTNTVLSHQASEMADVMRRACFFGRERGIGEERVTLAAVSAFGAGSEASGSGTFYSSSNPAIEPGHVSEEATSTAGEWLAETFTWEPEVAEAAEADGDGDGERW